MSIRSKFFDVTEFIGWLVDFIVDALLPEIVKQNKSLWSSNFSNLELNDFLTFYEIKYPIQFSFHEYFFKQSEISTQMTSNEELLCEIDWNKSLQRIWNSNIQSNIEVMTLRSHKFMKKWKPFTQLGF